MSELTAALQQHLSGAGLPETLSQLAGDDPRLAQVAQLLTLRQQQEAEMRDAENASEGNSLAQAQEELARAREEKERLEQAALTQRYIDELTVELKRVQDTIEHVAGALGACPVCLGQDRDCELCHGRGTPGSLPPDSEDFHNVVLPAVRAHAYTRSRSRRDRPPQQGSES